MSKILVGSDAEPLVSDKRLSQVYGVLARLIGVDIPEGLEFATQRQEPTELEDGTKQGAVAIFYVVSPHPSASKSVLVSPAKLISIATMPFPQWHSANKEYRHYANLTDPLRPIFAGLLRQHLDHRKNLEELKDN